MIAWLDLAARGEAEVVTSPMTLVEAYDGRTTEQRWDWVLSRLQVTVFTSDVDDLEKLVPDTIVVKKA